MAKYEGHLYDWFVTNVASSLVFEELLGDKVIRVPIGERNLAIKLHELENAFGGEGSCGGVMMTKFNNCRDGIFAAAKVIEIMHKTGKGIDELVDELPRFFAEKTKISIDAFEKLKKNLKEYETIENDIRISGEDWFVLIHPSNTEPIVRIIAVARSKEKAKELIDKYLNLASL